jgi:hypothetical protein
MGELGDKLKEHLTLGEIKVTLSRPNEWGDKLMQVGRGLFGLEMRPGDSKKIAKEIDTLGKRARERGVEIVGPFEFGFGEEITGQVAMVPLSAADDVSLFLPLEQELAKINGYAEVVKYSFDTLPGGNWIVRGPTSEKGGTSRAYYNNGAVIIRSNGEVREIGLSPAETVKNKGGIAISFKDKESKSGQLMLLSPKEIAEARDNPRERFGNGGMIAGVSTYFEVNPGVQETIEEVVIEIMRKNGYNVTSSAVVGFFLEAGEEFFYGNCWAGVREPGRYLVENYYQKVGIKKEEIPSDSNGKPYNPDNSILVSCRTKLIVMVESIWRAAKTIAEERGCVVRVAFMEEHGSAELRDLKKAELKDERERRKFINYVPEWVV